MHQMPWIQLYTSVLAGLIALSGRSVSWAAPSGPTPSPAVSHPLVRLQAEAARFLPNLGQWSDPSVRFGFRSSGLAASFGDSFLRLRLMHTASARIESSDVVMTFPGSNASSPRGFDRSRANFNFFVGGQGRKSVAHVPSFEAIRYDNLYDGIDLIVSGVDAEGALKYEFRVAPGAEWSPVRMHCDGVESLCLKENGDLLMELPSGTIRDRAPQVWQMEGGRKRMIASHFLLVDDHTYRIVVDGNVDPRKELILDPGLEWTTYLGGSDSDYGSAVVVTDTGEMFVTGTTVSGDFEGARNENHREGMNDVFVAKVDASGSLTWMCYVGGRDGDYPEDTVIDESGNVLLAGYTNSMDFDGRINSIHDSSSDAFVLKMDPLGAVQWMMYLGGSASDFGYGVGLAPSGDIIVVGSTTSHDFEGRINQLHGVPSDAFVAEVSDTGDLLWMAYYGGSGEESVGRGVMDGEGNVIVSGGTLSDDLDGRLNGRHSTEPDGYVMKIDPSGTLLWSRYLGGSGNDYFSTVSADSQGSALVTGSTGSSDFEGRNNQSHGGIDTYLAKVDGAGALQWMTYLGGSRWEEPHAVAVDGANNAFVSGITLSTDFDGMVNIKHGGMDAFVAKVDPAGNMQWVQYVGGSANETGQGIAISQSGDSVVIVGQTASSDLDNRTNAYHGETDSYVAMIRVVSPSLTVDASCPTGGPIQIHWDGATPEGQAALIFARNTGSFIIPRGNPCAGVILSLENRGIQQVFRGGAGSNGSRTLNAQVGPEACGGWMQLLDLSNCNLSNVASIE